MREFVAKANSTPNITAFSTHCYDPFLLPAYVRIELSLAPTVPDELSFSYILIDQILTQVK